MLIPGKQAGVSLIELMIGIVVVSLLMVMGAPSFSLWMQNTQVRTAAESIQNGLQIARTEAVRRNANVRFNLTDAGGTVAWSVDCVSVTTDCPAGIQVRGSGEGGANSRVGISAAALPSPIPANHFNTAIAAGTGLPAGVTFDGIGRVPTANVGTDISRIDVTNAVSANARRMVIIIGTGGQTRMCDPAIALAANPQGCS
jgi:type IV fimbrial biogenesis protein FimT